MRRGWAALVLLGLLTGLAAGVITAAVAGAERSASAHPRMRKQLRAADAVFLPSQVTTLDTISRANANQQEAFFLISPDRATEVTTLQANLQQAGIETAPLGPIADLENLADVRRLPYLLAGFLIVLGLGAVAHAPLTVSRRRVKELAVLRAVGLTPRQTAAGVTWQATVVALIALVIGIPLGLVVGRQVWRTVAASVPLVYVGPLSPALLALVIVGALAALLLVARRSLAHRGRPPDGMTEPIDRARR